MGEKGFGATNYPKAYRGNLRLIAHDESLAALVYERVKAVVPPEVRLPHPRKGKPDEVWEAYGLNPCWRLAKYLPGDRFQGHCDTAYSPEHNQDLSMFTVNVYLNDVEDGGSTRFYFGKDAVKEKEPNFSVAPKAGLCLLFRQPPGQEYYHDGEQLGSGLKYLIRSDVMYRKKGTGGEEKTAKKEKKEKKGVGDEVKKIAKQEKKEKKEKKGEGDGEKEKGKDGEEKIAKKEKKEKKGVGDEEKKIAKQEKPDAKG